MKLSIQHQGQIGGVALLSMHYNIEATDFKSIYCMGRSPLRLQGSLVYILQQRDYGSYDSSTQHVLFARALAPKQFHSSLERFETVEGHSSNLVFPSVVASIPGKGERLVISIGRVLELLPYLACAAAKYLRPFEELVQGALVFPNGLGISQIYLYIIYLIFYATLTSFSKHYFFNIYSSNALCKLLYFINFIFRQSDHSEGNAIIQPMSWKRPERGEQSIMSPKPVAHYLPKWYWRNSTPFAPTTVGHRVDYVIITFLHYRFTQV